MNTAEPSLYGKIEVIKPDWKKIIPFQVFSLMNIIFIPVVIMVPVTHNYDFPFNIVFLAALWNFIALLIWNIRAKLDKDIYVLTGPDGLSINVPAFNGFFFLLKYEKDELNLPWDQVRSIQPLIYTVNGFLQDMELRIESPSNKVYEIDLKYIIGFSVFNHEKKVNRLLEKIRV